MVFPLPAYSAPPSLERGLKSIPVWLESDWEFSPKARGCHCRPRWKLTADIVNISRRPDSPTLSTLDARCLAVIKKYSRRSEDDDDERDEQSSHHGTGATMWFQYNNQSLVPFE
eukprot:scaffold89936_cov59-Attheya_sp.AAC.4